MLSKSDYLRYLQCERYLWLFKNKKDLLENTELSVNAQRVINEGNEVEQYARLLFDNGVLVEGFNEKAQANTKRLLDSGETTLFQATVITDDLLAMADIFEFDKKNDYWVINEVKATSKVEDEHVADASFQKIVFEKAGFKVGKVNLIHINNEYVRQGEIDPKQLFAIEDITEQVLEIEPETEDDIGLALSVIQEKSEPEVEIIKQCQRNKPKECPFVSHCWKAVPEYSIYDLNRISKKKIQELLERGIQKITDIPLSDFPLTDIQFNQVSVAVSGEPMVDKEAIKVELGKLAYPQYWLDYETYFPAIPMFDGYKPFQQMVFQYSLHVIEAEEVEPKHYEYLERNLQNPAPNLLKSLRENMGDTGSVIVWNAQFETIRNKEMAEMLPEYASFLESVNERTYDLMEVFTKQLYVHPAFKGSTSIKKVLPVLAPELSYADLEISEGATASSTWFKMVSGSFADIETEEVYQNLLKYCFRDTMAMYVVYKALLAL